MTEPVRPRAVGLNHIALEVGDIEQALAFYGRLFRLELRSKSATMAFIDLCDRRGRKEEFHACYVWLWRTCRAAGARDR